MTTIPANPINLTGETLPPIIDPERAHHPYSPSSLQNREACPCFQNRESTHVKAIIGTMQHNVVETGEDDHRLSDDEALAAAECMDFYERQKQLLAEDRERAIKEDTTQLGDVTIGPLFTIPEVLDLVEEYLPVDDCEFTEQILGLDGLPMVRNFSGTTAGYVDRALIAWDRKRAILLDWKFGAWEVEDASNNLQGIAYSLGLLKKYPTLETVKFYFKQPAINVLTSATFTREQLPSLYLRLQTVVARAMAARQLTDQGDFSMATPHIPACNFCAMIGKCDKVAGFACKLGAKFYPLEIPADITPTGLKSPEDATMGMRLSTVMKVWADAFRATLSNRVIRRDAEVPPGYVIQSRSDREIVDSAKFVEVAQKYLTQDELMPLAKYTFGSVEAVVKDKAPRGSKKATLEEFQQVLLDSGAVKMMDPITFLRAVSTKGNKNETTEQQ